MKTCNVIDLSHHNAFTSLKGAKDAGVWGIIHKASESLGKDSAVAYRVPIIRDAGFLVGLYHFIRPGNVSKQVDFFLSIAKPLMDDDTLLCCDFEDASVSLIDVLSFMEGVELKTGRSPVLYGGSILKEAAEHDAVHAKELAQYRFWLAQYGPTAKLPKYFDKLWLWQYSEQGKIAGLFDPKDPNSHVDLDYFAGTQDELAAQWSRKDSGLHPVTLTDKPAEQTSVKTETPPANEGSIDKGDFTEGKKPQEPAKPPDSPVEVKKESPSLFAKVGAGVTAISGIGINVGSLIQTKLEAMTPAQIGYLVLALGLVALGVFWYVKSAKAAQQRTLALVEKAADPKQNTVTLHE